MLEAIKYPGITSAFIYGTGWLLVSLPFFPFMKRNILNLVVFALGCTLIVAASKIFEFSTLGIAPEIGFRDLLMVACISGAELIFLSKAERVKRNEKLLLAVGLVVAAISLFLLYLSDPFSQQPGLVTNPLNILGAIALIIGLLFTPALSLIKSQRLRLIVSIVGWLAFLLGCYWASFGFQ